MYCHPLASVEHSGSRYLDRSWALLGCQHWASDGREDDGSLRSSAGCRQDAELQLRGKAVFVTKCKVRRVRVPTRVPTEWRGARRRGVGVSLSSSRRNWIPSVTHVLQPAKKPRSQERRGGRGQSPRGKRNLTFSTPGRQKEDKGSRRKSGREGRQRSKTTLLFHRRVRGRTHCFV